MEIKQQLHAAGILVIEGYGLTETSPTLTINRPDDFRFDTVGKPVPNVEIKLAEDGEILARGPSVFRGYHDDPAATAAAFDDDGWFKTGDVGRWTEDGFLQIVDRKKDVIKSGGETVFSTEVEQVVYAHPAVQEAAVIGLPHPRWGEAVIAVVVPRAGVRADEEALLDHCRAHLGRHQVPKRVFFKTALPRTGSGKIAKRLLRDELASGPMGAIP